MALVMSSTDAKLMQALFERRTNVVRAEMNS